MATTSHTPGPYRLKLPDFNNRKSFNPSAYLSGPAWTGFASVFVMVNGEMNPEGVATAHLLSAAPDMLAVLEEVLTIFGSEGRTGLLERIEAAVAKAKGEGR